MKNTIIVLLILLLCVWICGCNDQGEVMGLTPLAQTILDKASDKPYDKLVTKSLSSNELFEYWVNYWYYCHGTVYTSLQHDQEAVMLMDQPGMREDIIVINEWLPIECLRRTNDAIYSVHSIDNTCLLYIEYDKYSVNGVSSLKAKLPSIILPMTVTLSDEEILSINEGVHMLKDVKDIDPMVNNAHMIDYHISTKIDIDTIVSTKEENLEEFCETPLFSTIHYTVEGNWYKISYGLNSDRFSSVYEWYQTTLPHGGESTLPSIAGGTSYKVLSVEKIDAPPILEQDLPK